jgi:beta-phosphoglucomutase-like phosphatase (HAD superfamily)
MTFRAIVSDFDGLICDNGPAALARYEEMGATVGRHTTMGS